MHLIEVHPQGDRARYRGPDNVVFQVELREGKHVISYH